jgi:hypothetical protein
MSATLFDRACVRRPLREDHEPLDRLGERPGPVGRIDISSLLTVLLLR